MSLVEVIRPVLIRRESGTVTLADTGYGTGGDAAHPSGPEGDCPARSRGGARFRQHGRTKRGVA